ncbi:MAG: patatin-like phospholipase family protein [Phycisphaerales bacterium]|nr:patatin-like phospholipase family protein [Phycisphaerales bacterium]
MSYRIMTFDGGGIGGLFTSVVLERLTDAFPSLIGDVDLLAGTSTGGIIALCLAAGKPPRTLVDLYGTHGPDIFDDSWLDNVLDLGTAIGAQYDNHKLKKRLVESLGKLTLGELAKHVLVPTFELHADADAASGRPRIWKPTFFHNYTGDNGGASEPAVDIAMRTSAAPSYFPSYQGFIDGGVVANNPAMCALAQALDRSTGRQSLDDIRLISFGTGNDARYIKGESLDWGWGQWAKPLVSIMVGGVMGVTDYQCRRLLRECYHRVDRYLDKPVNLDDVRPRTLKYLRVEAAKVDLGPTVEWLRKNWAE